jgi:hypothetical protein
MRPTQSFHGEHPASTRTNITRIINMPDIDEEIVLLKVRQYEVQPTMPALRSGHYDARLWMPRNTRTRGLLILTSSTRLNRAKSNASERNATTARIP